MAVSETTTDTGTVLLISLPGIITGILVVPIPNYHNVRTALKSIYLFYSNRRRYIWKGWCFYERFIKEYEAEKTKINSKYTEDWLPIKAIANGTIVLDNNMKVTGVKITPRNIFILDQITQENVIVALKNFYNTLDFEFWIISADRPVDISAYLAQLQLLYNSVNSTVIRK